MKKSSKRSGYFLASAVVLTFLLSLFVVGYFMSITGNISTVKATSTSLQGQYFAEGEITNNLRSINYNDLYSSVKQGEWLPLDSSPDWKYKVELSSEKIMDNGSPVRIADVQMKKDGQQDVFEKQILLAAQNTQSLTPSTGARWGDVDESMMEIPDFIEKKTPNYDYYDESGPYYNGTAYTNGSLVKYFIMKKDGLLVAKTFDGRGRFQYSTFMRDFIGEPTEAGIYIWVNDRFYYSGSRTTTSYVTIPIKKGDVVHAYGHTGRSSDDYEYFYLGFYPIET